MDHKIDRIEITACKIPTDVPESDGTLAWDSTTIVIVHAWSRDTWGMGYTYADAAAGRLIENKLVEQVRGRPAMDISGGWSAMVREVRNDGRPGLASTAISAVDNALWDLKARLLNLPLAALLGQVRNAAPIYGSGGFTSYNDKQLTDQLSGWVEQGIPRVKMKVGRDAHADVERVAAARHAIGDDAELFVDANGGYMRKEALEMAHVFAEDFGVTWFEEPRPSDDLDGLRLLRDRAPAGMDIAAGEYGYTLPYFKRMLDAQAVDCLQADVTRCGGITGMLGVAALCEASHMPLSAHCAPAQSAAVCCAMRPLRHLEYFHDHVRIERMLFDGLPSLAPLPPGGVGGGDLRLANGNAALAPNLTRPGNGLTLKREDAREYEV